MDWMDFIELKDVEKEVKKEEKKEEKRSGKDDTVYDSEWKSPEIVSNEKRQDCVSLDEKAQIVSNEKVYTRDLFHTNFFTRTEVIPVKVIH